MDGIPPAAKTDAEDVVWALQTADALWKRDERVDAIVWLRRAAQAASESQNDDRALLLARHASDLSEWIAHNPAPARSSEHEELVPDDVEPAHFEDEIITDARMLAAISGEVLVPSDLRAAAIAQRAEERLELPKRVSPVNASPRRGVPPPLPPRRAPAPPRPSPDLAPPPSPRAEPAPSSMRSPQPTMSVEDEELLPSLNLTLIDEEDDAGVQVEPEPSDDANSDPQPDEPHPEPPVHAQPTPSLSLLEESDEPEPPTDAAAFDSVTQKIKADLRALDVSARRAVREEAETSTSGPTTAVPPAPSTPSGPELAGPELGGVSSPPPRVSPASEAPGSPPDADRATIDLSALEAFADLPDDARETFATAAMIHELRLDEEAVGFALAVVIDGEVDVCATIAEAAGERLSAGAVLRARGSVGPAASLRFVCASEQARVATWDDSAVEEGFRTSPWVEEDLCAAADRTHALIGATLGPLGDRLDASIRKQITDRLHVRALEPGDVLVEKGQPVPGVVLVGAGYLEIVEGGRVIERVSAGQFVFSTSILGGGAAPATARASSDGTIVLFGDRMVAHELLLTCPPLLEVLAGM